MVGIKKENLPDTDEQKILTASISKHYGGLTDEQIKLAFELYATGKIEAEEHYQSFSLKFISSVLNSYIDEMIKVMKFENNRQKKETKEKVFIGEVDWSETYRFMIDAYKEDRKDIPIPLAMYDWMKKQNKLTVTPEEKQAYFQKALKHLERQVYNRWKERPNRNDRLILDALKTLTKEDREYLLVIEEAKKLLMKNHFEIEAQKEIEANSSKAD